MMCKYVGLVSCSEKPNIQYIGIFTPPAEQLRSLLRQLSRPSSPSPDLQPKAEPWPGSELLSQNAAVRYGYTAILLYGYTAAFDHLQPNVQAVQANRKHWRCPGEMLENIKYSQLLASHICQISSFRQFTRRFKENQVNLGNVSNLWRPSKEETPCTKKKCPGPKDFEHKI